MFANYHTEKEMFPFSNIMCHASHWGCAYFCRETSMTSKFFMLLTLNFSDGCGCLSSSIECDVNFQVSGNCTLLYPFF